MWARPLTYYWLSHKTLPFSAACPLVSTIINTLHLNKSAQKLYKELALNTSGTQRGHDRFRKSHCFISEPVQGERWMDPQWKQVMNQFQSALLLETRACHWWLDVSFLKTTLSAEWSMDGGPTRLKGERTVRIMQSSKSIEGQCDHCGGLESQDILQCRAQEAGTHLQRGTQASVWGLRVRIYLCAL